MKYVNKVLVERLAVSKSQPLAVSGRVEVNVMDTVMRRLALWLCGSLLLLFIACSGGSYSRDAENSDNGEDASLESSEYEDGTYCAEVEYYNPSTGTRNTYDLDVEVESGELTVIHWPNGGWLDDTHFSPGDITSGEYEFTSDRGYEYTVTLGEPGGCGSSDGYKMRDDVNDEVEATTCPKCGDEKEEYDKYCYSCKRKAEDEEENTCSRCGSYEYGVHGGVCSSCEREEEGQERYEVY